MESRAEVVATPECTANLSACSLYEYGGNKNDGQDDLDVGQKGFHWGYPSIDLDLCKKFRLSVGVESAFI
jgi:hypothetical protein